ncbi:MAG: GNAT family N-acetyltransferase [Alphaproteobacteria bacterium]|nr:GNAT family N-acetyltransferase [Alphaproteobacteria bacterium]
MLRPTEGFEMPELGGETDIAQLFPPGAFGVFALSGNTLVGLARIFSDTVATAWLAELCVAPGWRDRGIEDRLLNQVNDRFHGTALYSSASVETVELFKAAGVRPKVKLIACHRPPGRPAAELDGIPNIVIHDDATRHQATDYDDVVDSAFGISDTGTDDMTYLRRFGEGISGFFAETMAGRLVGVVHIFSDDLTKSYIAEICVHPEFQRRGIGRALLGRTVARFSHTAIWAESFPETIPVLGICGIIPDPRFVGCSRAPLE